MVQVVDHLRGSCEDMQALCSGSKQSRAVFCLLCWFPLGYIISEPGLIMMEQFVVERDGYGTRWFWMFSFLLMKWLTLNEYMIDVSLTISPC